MSDFTRTANDTPLELVAADQGRTRLAQRKGQTAAEYMGILMVIALVIGALAMSEIPTKLVTAVETQITNIGTKEKE